MRAEQRHFSARPAYLKFHARAREYQITPNLARHGLGREGAKR
jgi:hypothetical protein